MTKTVFVTKSQIEEARMEAARLAELGAEQQERLDTYVACLGNTPAEIARGLRKRGIKATKGNPRKCALAEDLRRAFGLEDVYVSRASNMMVDDFVAACPKNGAAIEEFISKFDEGRYPSLVRK